MVSNKPSIQSVLLWRTDALIVFSVLGRIKLSTENVQRCFRCIVKYMYWFEKLSNTITADDAMMTILNSDSLEGFQILCIISAFTVFTQLHQFFAQSVNL